MLRLRIPLRPIVGAGPPSALGKRGKLCGLLGTRNLHKFAGPDRFAFTVAQKQGVSRQGSVEFRRHSAAGDPVHGCLEFGGEAIHRVTGPGKRRPVLAKR